MNRKLVLIILTLIIVVAAVLRLWRLGHVPPSPDWDEAALGYNAYSIMHTGRDEYGKLLPVVLRSFDDYKPALYAYLAIPSIAVFGLNLFAVRLPSAVFGILTVLATYFLVKELFEIGRKTEDLGIKKSLEIKNFKLEITALLSAMLVAISPWSIQFSRVAFEANAGLAFNVFAALFFLKGLKKPRLLFLSAFLMGLNLYVYQSEKVFTPLLLLMLVFIFRKELFSLPKKYIIISVLIGLLLSLPMVGFILGNRHALERAQGVSVFAESTQLLSEDARKLIQDGKNHDILGLILDNRRIVFAKLIAANYLSHFDLNWLFITGDIARHHAPDMGLLYPFELPFVLIGIYQLIFGNFNKKTKLVIFFWFLIAPVPASVTTGVPHAVRTLNFLPTFQIFAALGILQVFSYLKQTDLRFKIHDLRGVFLILGSALCVLFAFLNFVYYLDQYFVQQNYFNARDWQYGYAKMVPQVKKIETNYKKIVVSNQPPMDQSYMFFLFYLKYPPAKYQKELKGASGGFRENHAFGRFEFRLIDWNREKKTSDILYVGTPQDFPTKTGKLYIVYYPNGRQAMEMIK